MKIGNVIDPLRNLHDTVHSAKSDISDSMKGINATVMITGQFPYSVAESLNGRIKGYCDTLEKQLNDLIEAGKEEELLELRKLVIREVLVTNQFITHIKLSVNNINTWLNEKK